MNTQLQTLSEIVEQARDLTRTVFDGAEYSAETGKELNADIGKAIAAELLPYLKSSQPETRWYIEEGELNWKRYPVLEDWKSGIEKLCKNAVRIIKDMESQEREQATALYSGLKDAVVGYFSERVNEAARDAARCTRKAAESINYIIEEGNELTKATAEHLLGVANKLYTIKERTEEQETAYNTVNMWYHEVGNIYSLKENLLGRIFGVMLREEFTPHNIRNSCRSLNTVNATTFNKLDSFNDFERNMLKREEQLFKLARVLKRPDVY